MTSSRKLVIPNEYLMQRWAQWTEMLLTEGKDIRKRWQEYTEELKKQNREFTLPKMLQ